MTNMNSNARVARPIMSRENGSRIPYPVSWTRYPVSWSRYHPTPTPYHPTAGILWGYTVGVHSRAIDSKRLFLEVMRGMFTTCETAPKLVQ